ncbi:MAG TPA: GNAT family N-acetyltransferase [Puia sp.]|jgi:ribosomal protein S18 acetylase RimI-like enzyme
MIQTDLTQLDNPLWHALKGAQQAFSIGSAHVRRYRPGILPFAAYDYNAPDKIIELDNFLDKDAIFFLVGELPALPPHWQLIRELPCLQMILEPAFIPIQDTPAVIPLTLADKDPMFELIRRVQPGYYERDTHELGNYFGVFENKKLVAIAGERMRLEGMIEISAVCTDPAYTGRGYAQQLIFHICQANRGKRIFLHVLTSNERAIRLYEHLGFRKRREISFWKLICNGK